MTTLVYATVSCLYTPSNLLTLITTPFSVLTDSKNTEECDDE